MPRVKRSVHARKKRRKVLEEAKGYWGLKKSNYTYAKEQVERSLAYAYRDRKVRKREFRQLWIMRINAGARANGLSYNQFMAGLKAANVELDRKVLADLAVADPAKFGEIVEQAKAALARSEIDARRQREIFERQAVYCDGRSPLYARVCRRARRRPAGRRRRARPRAGTCRCGCSAGCTTSCSAARRRGTTLDAALERHGAVPAPLVRGAGGADERGAARRGRSCRRSSRSTTDGRSTCSSSARPPGSTCSGTATRTATRRARGGAASSSCAATTACRRRPRCSSGVSRWCVGAAST